jgi:polar amino acid transport system ATP-binding protein
MKLDVRDIRKSFGQHEVLRGIDLTLDGPASLALIGPSGGGKSTFLRLIAGLDHPTAGTIALNDARVPFEDDRKLREHRMSVGVVFQSFNLFPHLTASENVALPLRVVHGRTPDAALDVANALLEKLKLAGHGHKRPGALSGGQKQRVAIARALAAKPKVLLLDEPTSALDPEMTIEVLETIEALRDEGTHFVIVTHEIGFARRVAQHVALLAEGQIVEHGAAEAVLDAPSSAIGRAFLQRVLKF